jgi:hypothetical protein
MRLKSVVLAFSLSLICFLPQVTFADQLTLVSANSIIYPYVFDVTIGSTTTDNVDLSCLSYNREVTIGESWQVTTTNLKGFSGSIDGSSATQLDEDAYLDSLYNSVYASNSEIQYAIWDILDPSGVASQLDNTSKQLVTDAENFAAKNPDTAAFYSQFTLFTPTWNETGWTKGEPQEFMEFTPIQGLGAPPPAGVTPEPASLVLLGTGLIGSVLIMRRRLVPAPAAATDKD